VVVIRAGVARTEAGGVGSLFEEIEEREWRKGGDAAQ
jgi:hypothetical protein